MEKYLREQMPEIIAGWSEDRIKKRSYALCHDPRLQANFDQKGHALGGSEVKVLAMKLRRCQDRRCSGSDDVVEKGVCIHRQPTGCILYPCSSFWYQSLSLTSVRARARGSVFYYML